MKIFIELPTWLGDAVMATPAIETLLAQYPHAKVIFFGSFASTSLFTNHPNKHIIIVDKGKKSFFRSFYLYKLSKKVQTDIAISFRSSLYAKILLFFIHCPKKLCFKKSKETKHQVLRYLHLIDTNFSIQIIHHELKLYFTPQTKTKKLLGLNPGATYGSAKRWYPEYFAQVAQEFANEYEIVIFGSQNEKKIADEIEHFLLSQNIACKNLTGKTTVQELCEYIANLDLFITNDSGPMHIGAAFKIPTIALFGPTKFTETSPWNNKNALLVHKNLSCMPCMKRVCPIKTHECMKSLMPHEVIQKIKENFI